MLTNHRTILLDDDPTGTQAASNVDVLFSFEESDFIQALTTQPTVFVLTNTRSLDETAAVELVSSIRRHALAAAASLGVTVDFVLRGDSTLRGHVFAESAVFMDENAVLVFCPAFPDGGRATRGGVHYLMGSDQVERPVHLTEYAKDPVFGFTCSNLVDFAQERTGRPAISVPGMIVRADASSADGTRPVPVTTEGCRAARQAVAQTKRSGVVSEHERHSSAVTLSSILIDAPAGTTIIPDVESNDDITRIAAAIRLARRTRPIVVRCAAPLAVELGGVASHGLMSFADLDPRRRKSAAEVTAIAEASKALTATFPSGATPMRAGMTAIAEVTEAEQPNLPHPHTRSSQPLPPRILVVCGSHTAAATAQLDALSEIWPGRAVVNTDLALTDPLNAIARAIDDVTTLWKTSPVAVLTTERVRRPDHATLADGAAVMEALIAVVHQVATQADVVISKGGITSADVAERGLDGRSATVLGQLAIGISLWEVHTDSGEDRPLVVVPGNVGDDTTLVSLVKGIF